MYNQGGYVGQPSYPPMAMPAMAYPTFAPSGQPATRGGKGRGRGYANTPRARSLVPQIKEESRTATSGQLLELTRFFAATLSRVDASLYGQFLAGLGHKTPAGTSASASSDAPSLETFRMIVADRKKRWFELCQAHDDVKYWQSMVDIVKAKHGSNASVDELILADETVDLRRYQRGRLARESLLAKAGLVRDGSSLKPIDDQDTSSDAGIPATSTPTDEEKRYPQGSASSTKFDIDDSVSDDHSHQLQNISDRISVLANLVTRSAHSNAPSMSPYSVPWMPPGGMMQPSGPGQWFAPQMMSYQQLPHGSAQGDPRGSTFAHGMTSQVPASTGVGNLPSRVDPPTSSSSQPNIVPQGTPLATTTTSPPE